MSPLMQVVGNTNISRSKYAFEKRVRKTRHDHKDQREDREIAVSNHLKCFAIEHPGKTMVRKVIDSFEVIGSNGIYECLLYQPLGMNFTEFLKLLPQNRLLKDLAQTSIQILLMTLDYLQRCQVVHTGMC